MKLTDNTTIAVLGDVHGHSWVVNSAIRAIDELESKHKPDLLIQVGDFACYSKKDIKSLSYECKKHNITLVFIPGNHEDWNYLNTLSINTIKEIAPKVFYAPIGSEAFIGYKKALFIGGAVSVDKYLRKPGLDWFPQETISLAQYYNILDNTSNDIDVVFSHDCPLDTPLPEQCFGLKGLLPEEIEQEAEQHRKTLQELVDNVKPSLLIHGHYHHYYETIVRSNYSKKVVGLALENHQGARLLIDLEDNTTMKF